jgi:hypothetical protein
MKYNIQVSQGNDERVTLYSNLDYAEARQLTDEVRSTNLYLDVIMCREN